MSSIKSNDGKTTVVCGLAGVFFKLGLDFDVIKIGPDYLDLMCVGNFANVNKINLVVQFSEQFYRWLAWVRNSSLVEDCMGVMDKCETRQSAASCLVSHLKAKLVLVLNCKNVMQTVAYISSIISSKLSGVILNNVMSYRHETIIIKAVNSVIGAPVLGVLYADAYYFKQRHLGIVRPSELANSQAIVDSLISKVYHSCNVFELARLMNSS
ncbi:MAG: hypothetical protein AAI978_00390 [Candidatus Hodgkinia cicadicola]